MRVHPKLGSAGQSQRSPSLRTNSPAMSHRAQNSWLYLSLASEAASVLRFAQNPRSARTPFMQAYRYCLEPARVARGGPPPTSGWSLAPVPFQLLTATRCSLTGEHLPHALLDRDCVHRFNKWNGTRGGL